MKKTAELSGIKSDYEKMKAIAQAYATKTECSIPKHIWLC